MIPTAEPDLALVAEKAIAVPPAPSTRASDKFGIVVGIYERMLPDGQIAFLADPEGDARDRLALACKGLAKLNPRYRNWLSDAGQASIIREALLTTHQERSEVDHGTG